MYTTALTGFAAAALLSTSAHAQGITPVPADPTTRAPADSTRSGPIGPPPATLVEPGRRTVATGFQFLQGPLWWKNDRLLVSDVPGDTLYLLKPGDEPIQAAEAQKLRSPSGNTCGTTLDLQGRIICAQHDGKITRIEPDGSVTRLASEFEGKRFNSPSDVAVRSDGLIYFTDPPFGITKDQRQLDFCGVFVIAPAGSPKAPHRLTLLTKEISLPNGVAFSPDEKHLYISDYHSCEIRLFDVAQDGSITNNRLFAELKSPPIRGGAEGLKVDSAGNVYAAGPGGVWVLSPAGEKLGRINVANPSNVAFGGLDARTLFITAGNDIYSVRLKTPGEVPGPRVKH